MTDTISSESVDAMAKILLESFHAPLQSISNELEKLEYEFPLFLPEWKPVLSSPAILSTDLCFLPLRQSQLGWLSRIDVENSKFLGNEPELKEAILLVRLGDLSVSYTFELVR